MYQPKMSQKGYNMDPKQGFVAANTLRSKLRENENLKMSMT